MAYFTDFLAHPPYRMVFMSGIALIIALFIIISYTKIYPKKKMPYWSILIILSIPPIISIFRQGVYESGDFYYHAGRTYSFYNSLQDGVIFPRWSAEDNAHYGYALFNYVYPFPYYFTSLLYSLGFNLINSVKIFLASAFIFSGTTMYLWLKQIAKPKAAFLGAVLYLFAPYHFIDLHFRSHIGEVLSFLLLPLMFLFITKATLTKKFLWIFLSGISIAFLITSHPAVALIGLIVAVFYSILISDFDLNKLTSTICSVLLGLAFSAYYWIPLYLDQKPTSPNPSELTFLSISDIFYSPWRWGLLFQGPQGEYSLLLGYSHWLIIFISIFLLLLKKQYRSRKLIYFLIASLILVTVVLDISRPIWENVPILGNFGVSYRVFVVIAFTTSTLAALIINKLNSNRLYILIMSVAILSTILNWGNRGTIPQVSDSDIIKQFSYLHAPNNLWKSEKPEKPIQALDGDLEILNQTRNSVKHEYVVYKKAEGWVQENTYYYPGWKLFVNGQEREIHYDVDPIPKMMKFNLEPGLHNVVIIFQDNQIRLTANLITAITFTLSGLYLLRSSTMSDK